MPVSVIWDAYEISMEQWLHCERLSFQVFLQPETQEKGKQTLERHSARNLEASTII